MSIMLPCSKFINDFLILNNFMEYISGKSEGEVGCFFDSDASMGKGYSRGERFVKHGL